MRTQRRVWVLPALFAVVVLSLPAQMLFAERFAEPYPGLFQPKFVGVSKRVGDAVQLRVVEVRVDGRRIEPYDLFPGDGSAAAIVRSMFPPRRDRPRLGDRARASLRDTLTHRFGGEPQTLTVVWERRQFRLDTGTLSSATVLARHRIDLTGGGR